MYFRYFSSLFGAVVWSLSASFCELYDVSIHFSKNLTANYITYRTILFTRSRSQSSHPLCWVSFDTKWSHYICLLGTPSPLWHRCDCNYLPHEAIRNVLKFKLCISNVGVDRHSSLESLWAPFDVHSSLQFLIDNLDRSRGRTRLVEVVYRDGESDLQALLLFSSN